MEQTKYEEYALTERAGVPVMLYHDGADYVAGSTWRGPDANDKDAYSGFSVCGYVGDSEEHTRLCRSQLKAAFKADALVQPRQTHTATVAVFAREPLQLTNMRIVAQESELQDVDAVVTGERGVMIGVNTADCVPVLMADATAGVIAAVHAGWRGAVAGIVPEAVAVMRRLGADVSATRAYIGPCIHACCFEVGEEVAEQFPASCVNTVPGSERPHVDLVRFVTGQLHDAGVTAVSAAAMCTRCNPSQFFSARARGIRSGRIFSFAMLR